MAYLRRAVRLAPACLLAVTAGCGDDGLGVPSPSPAWKKHAANPVLSRGPAGSWDALGVGTPCVLAETSGYRMWFAGRDSSFVRIGVATSTDGVTWAEHAENPVLGLGAAGTWEALGVEAPCVLRDGTGYRMYYAGRGAGPRSIGLATSPDGVHWSRASDQPLFMPSPPGSAWDDGHVARPSVLLAPGSYTMWYAASGSDIVGIGRAVSDDGVGWTRALAPVLHGPVLEAIVSAPCVVVTRGLYRMWYVARHESPVVGFRPGDIDYAQSLDGIEWISNRTVLSPGDPGSWDGHALRSTWVLDGDRTTRMWYEGAGSSGSGPSAIGLATFE